MQMTTSSLARLRRAARAPKLGLTRAVTTAALTAGLLALPATGLPFGTARGAPVAEAAQQGCPRTLVRGSHGEDVTRLQRELNQVIGPPLRVDSIFGKETETSVIALQLSRNLSPDAVVGPKTWHALGVC